MTTFNLTIKYVYIMKNNADFQDQEGHMAQMSDLECINYQAASLKDNTVIA